MYKIIKIFIMVIIVVALGLFIYLDMRVYIFPKDNTSQNNEKIKQSNINLTLSEESVEDIEIKQELIYPDIKQDLSFPDTFSEEAREIIQNNILTLASQLKTNPTSFNDWLDLATQYKIIEDYENAREIWEFLNIAFPGNSVSFTNLGNLYHYYLKDFPKAEQNLYLAIENDKTNTSSYIGLHELYKYSYKQDTDLVTAVLFEGLMKNPNDTNLLVTLANYYKEKGDTTNARKYYKQARDEAEKLKNFQLIQLLDEEISNL